MNQFDVEAELDKRLIETELLIEKRLRAAQKTILAQLADMYAKYERDGALTYQEIQKYNRLEKELKRITDTLTAEYQQVVTQVQEMQENHYLLKFLLTAYLLDQFLARPSLPSTEVIGAVFIFITGALKLPRLSKSSENDAVKSILREFKQGIADNDSKDGLIKRIQRVLPSTVKESAPQLTDVLIERIETPVNVINVVSPSPVEVKKAVKNEDKALTLPKIFTKHRNKLAAGITDEINAGLKKGESYAQLAKRLEQQFDMSANRARLVARNESSRVRAVAQIAVEEQVKEFAKFGGLWLSALDARVRTSHRKLDGKRADSKGYFHYGVWKALGPHLWGIPHMDINCRCQKLMLVNNQIPEYRRGRDYTDIKYQQKLADRIEQFMVNESLTYKQALKKARKEVLPPSVVTPYLSFDEWLVRFGERN